jgi:long-chain fatty acid transport protein
MKKRRSPWAARLAGALALLLPAASVQAGGLTLVDRGARPLSRGGAFVAGADDPGALWYNPAGLDESKNQILTDATLVLMFASYQRQYSDGTFSNEVKAKPTPLPIPTLAFSHKFGLKDFTFGGGIFAPNTLLMNYDRSSVSNGMRVPSPTRYALLGLNGSVLSNLVLGLAYHGIKGLSIGADVQVVAGRFKTDVALTTCGDGIVCNFPEDPDFDTYSTLDVLPALGVTGVGGIKYNFHNILRFGASVMLPYTLQGTGKLDTVLPKNNPLFENAHVQGDQAKFSMNFPLIVRVGSEIRPWPSLRLEGAFVWEQWSSQKSIDITPQNVSMVGIRGIGDYDVGPIKMMRNMNDVWSVRGGYEFFVPAKMMMASLKKIKLAMRGGLAYETSAFTKQTLTPLTLDSNKLLITGGFGLNFAKWLRFETAAGWYMMENVQVTNSTIQRPQAIRPASTTDNVTLGNGKYKMEAIYLGGGFNIYLD